ncbi:hypothetical protein SLS63_000375 [Diaporthe eres]|uniref:Uncharacterized protein n=1 Tax=Diaporthe eres TaxID=83184 RepID=A0ABR1PQL5_DIAER
MPPRTRGGRAAPAGSAAPGRQSTRIAAQMEAAQQAAGQPAAEETAPEPEPVITAAAAAAAAAADNDTAHDTDASLNASPGDNDDDNNVDDDAAPESSVPPPNSTKGGRGTGRAPEGPMTPHQVNPAVTYDHPDAGTPILTPRTRDAKVNLMNKFVDRLYSASTDMLTHLALEGPERDEPWEDELQTHKDIFENYYKVYNEKSDDFIDIVFVSDKTKAEESTLWSRMTKAVATANLAKLLSSIQELEDDPNLVLERLPRLEKIDGHFPVAFVPGGSKGLDASVPDDAILKQAFHIRTQRYIETLRGVQNAVPLRLFARVFLDVNLEGVDDDSISRYIEGAPLRAFPGFDISNDNAQKYRDAIDRFRAMILEMDTTAIISNLDQDYPFQIFLDELKDWIKSFEAKINAPTQPLSLNGDGSYSVEEQLQQDMRAAHIGK